MPHDIYTRRDTATESQKYPRYTVYDITRYVRHTVSIQHRVYYIHGWVGGRNLIFMNLINIHHVSSHGNRTATFEPKSQKYATIINNYNHLNGYYLIQNAVSELYDLHTLHTYN